MTKKYFLIYKEFFKTSLAEELSFRFNFLIQSFMNISLLGVYFLSSLFIFDHVSFIGLWEKDEFLFFLSFALLLDQTHYFLLSFNYWILSDNIKTGYFDFILLKPISTLFTTFFSRLAIPGVLTIPICFLIFLYFGLKLDLSLWVWLSLPVCFFFAMALLFGIEVIISLLNFITIEGLGVNQIRLQVQQLSRWPDFIYKKTTRFFLMPFLAITSIPVRWILDMSYWSWFIAMIGATAMLWFIILFWVWPSGLNRYESASS